MNNDFLTSILVNQEKVLNEAIEDVFEELPLSEDNKDKLKLICAHQFCKKRYSNQHSGIVVAGFGKNEIYPSLMIIIIDGMINYRLKYNIEDIIKINENSNAAIVPFAQSEMVATFMEGIDPNYQQILNGYLSELFYKYPDIITETLTIRNPKKKEFIRKMRGIGKDLIKDLLDKLKDFQTEYYVRPITQVAETGLKYSLINGMVD